MSPEELREVLLEWKECVDNADRADQCVTGVAAVDRLANQRVVMANVLDDLSEREPVTAIDAPKHFVLGESGRLAGYFAWVASGNAEIGGPDLVRSGAPLDPIETVAQDVGAMKDAYGATLRMYSKFE